jgi:uncharacterized protein (TIRG00374 family)
MTWLRWVTRGSLAIGVVALIATIRVVGFDAIFGYLREIGWLFLVLIALEAIATVIEATAVYIMARGDEGPSWRAVVVAQFAGRGVNMVTPGANLGEALKVSLLARRCPPRRIVAAVMYTVLVTIVFALAVVALGAFATTLLYELPGPALAGLLGGAVLVAAAAVGIVVLLRRGMLTTLANAAARVRVVSPARRQTWTQTLADIDARLRGEASAPRRRRAIACVLAGQSIHRALTYLTVLAAGYELSAAQFLALLSAGILIGWIATLTPMGIGISESGNAALFALLGAPAALGLALAIARRVNQVVFAVLGFLVLTADRIASRVASRVAHAGEALVEAKPVGVRA